MQQAQTINERIVALAATSCVELFSAYGVALEPSNRVFTTTDDYLLCGTVGFVGRTFRGSCLVAGSESPLSASCPSGNRLRDWVGELANQLAGRLKAKLIDLGVEMSLTTPIVICGVRLEPLPQSDVSPPLFASAHGDVLAWAEAEVAPGFVFGSEHPRSVREAGEVLLF